MTSGLINATLYPHGSTCVCIAHQPAAGEDKDGGDDAIRGDGGQRKCWRSERLHAMPIAQQSATAITINRQQQREARHVVVIDEADRAVTRQQRQDRQHGRLEGGKEFPPENLPAAETAESQRLERAVLQLAADRAAGQRRPSPAQMMPICSDMSTAVT